MYMKISDLGLSLWRFKTEGGLHSVLWEKMVWLWPSMGREIGDPENTGEDYLLSLGIDAAFGKKCCCFVSHAFGLAHVISKYVTRPMQGNELVGPFWNGTIVSISSPN